MQNDIVAIALSIRPIERLDACASKGGAVSCRLGWCVNKKYFFKPIRNLQNHLGFSHTKH